MVIIITAFLLGVLLAGAAAYSLRDLLKRQADIKLKKDNDYFREEVVRLRAQVALHIDDGQRKGCPDSTCGWCNKYMRRAA